MKNKAKQFSSIAIALVFIFSAFGSGETKSPNNSFEQAETSSTRTSSTAKNTCTICGKDFIGKGYQEIGESDWKPCEEPYQCFICSPECGRKHIKDFNKVLDKYGIDISSKNSNNQSNSDCSFSSDNDVLSYLVGKTFTQQGGGIEIRFSTDGAIISGQEEYQWQTYQSLGSYKGFVKLASINPSHPDGTIKLWVSCRENSVTDGETVLLYN